MSENQTLYLQLIGLVILTGIASMMLFGAYRTARDWTEEAVGIAKRFPALAGMLGVLVALPVALALVFALGGA